MWAGVYECRPPSPSRSSPIRDIAEADKILRACVHCGFCTATCPTYVLLGDELDSPRGRIYLIKDMLENDRPADRRGRQAHRPLPLLPCLHDDLPVGRALHAPRRPCARPYRGDLPAAVARPGVARAARRRAALSRPVPRGARGRLARRWRIAACSRALAAPQGRAGRDRLARPRCAGSPRCSACARRVCRTARPTRGRRVPAARARARAASRCCRAAPSPCSRRRSTRRRSACSPATASRSCCAAGEGCCGSLVHHMGREAAGARAGARQHRRLDARDRNGGLDAILITASGCGTTIKDYGFMLRDDPAYAGEGRARLSALRQGHLRVSRRARSRRAGAHNRLDGRLPLRLLAAARPENHEATEGLAGELRLRGARRRPRRISAAARPAPTTSCSPRSPRRCATARSRTSSAPAPTSSRPAISAA